MIMTKKDEGTYKQVGFIYRNDEIDVSGEVPVDFNTTNGIIGDYTIKGNAYQSDGVSPDTPQEVKAVGDRTGNLFDYKKYFESTFTKYNDYFEGAEIQLKPFTTYTFTTSFGERIDTVGKLETAFIIATSTEEPRTVNGGISSTRIRTKMTEADGIIKICKRIKGDYLPKKEDFDSGMHWLMINEGDTALSYEPYGYKIPIVTRGKNLIDVANVTGKTSTLFTDNVNPKLAQVKFDEATQYTISMKFEIDTRLGWRKITFTYTDGTTSVSPWIAASGVFKYTSTSGKTIAKVEFTNYNYYGDVSVEYIQLEAGTEATEYEPYHEPITIPIYLPTPLYSGEVIRSDGSREVKLKGTKIKNIQWTYSSEYSRFVSEYIKSNIPAAPVRSTIGYSDIYECLHNGENFDISWSNKFYIGADGKTIQIYIHDTRFNNVNDFVSSVGEYKIYFPVDLTTETFTAPQIPTLNGTTVIDVDTAVKPTKMYAKYKSSK